MNTLTQKVAGFLTTASCLLAVTGYVQAASSSQIGWGFENSTSPAQPDVNTSGIAGAQATVQPGELSLGWRNSQPGLDGGSGLWDLGKSGMVRLELPAANLTKLSVRVRQWNDGFIYSECTTVTVPGAILKSATQVEETTGPVGGWVVQTTVWEAVGATSISRADIAGVATGSVIDQITLVTEAAVVQPVILSIQPVAVPAGSVEVSWPESAGAAVVESSTDLNDAQSWTALAAAAQLINGRYSLVVETGETPRFFRLKR